MIESFLKLDKMKFVYLFVLVFISFLFSSCKEEAEKELIAVGGPRYGGEFRFMSTEKITNLHPSSATDVYQQRILNQIFESLLKIDNQTMLAVPCLAESFTLSPDAKKYTFALRKGILFHDNDCFSNGKGKEMTAKDVKFSLEYACSGLSNNESSSFLTSRIKGAKEFNEKTKKSIKNQSVSGIKIINDYEISVELIEPYVNFDKLLTHSNLAIFPIEAFEKYGTKIGKNPVGTGAFQMESWSNEKIVLKRNPKYWKKDIHGNQLPFLDKIIMTYTTTKKDELLAFRNEKIDLVMELPVDEIDNVIGSFEDAQAGKNIKHRMDAVSSLSLTYLGMRHDLAPFNDVKVRKAFNQALNRNLLVDVWMKGEGFPMLNGYVPAYEGYNSSKIKGHAFDVENAQKLLAQAGYPNGKNFPVIDLYVNAKNGSILYELIRGVKSQLKQNLNVDINIISCSIEEREKAVRDGKALLWRSGWVADYPDAENFLDLFYSKNDQMSISAVNLMKYKNPTFDTYFAASFSEKDDKKRLDLLMKCDQIIVDDAVVIPLMNDDFFTMIHSRIRDFSTNSMEILDFSTIFIKEPRK
jgi:oligopeptide transport system substrate-binding protein